MKTKNFEYQKFNNIFDILNTIFLLKNNYDVEVFVACRGYLLNSTQIFNRIKTINEIIKEIEKNDKNNPKYESDLNELIKFLGINNVLELITNTSEKWFEEKIQSLGFSIKDLCDKKVIFDEEFTKLILRDFKVNYFRKVTLFSNEKMYEGSIKNSYYLYYANICKQVKKQL